MLRIARLAFISPSKALHTSLSPRQVKSAPIWPPPMAYGKRIPTLTRDDLDPQQDPTYPRIPAIPNEDRDPYFKWDDVQERRNFGEPLHMDADVLAVQMPSHNTSTDWGEVGRGWAKVLSVFAVAMGLIYYANSQRTLQVVAQMYPRDGLYWESGGPGSRPRKPFPDDVKQSLEQRS